MPKNTRRHGWSAETVFYKLPCTLGARQRGHEAIIGMRCRAEQIVLIGVLRRVVQKTQIVVILIGENGTK